ncbi:MAG: transporter [Bacteroidales bacterium]|nr:transporter [Bacteroidales bacterium]MCF8391005.1 transporter [Bacteroidales bacterium]
MLTNSIYKCLLISVLVFIFSFSWSQELITDRPDQTESSATVPKGSLQWESGFWIEKDAKSLIYNDFQINSMGINSSLLRYGILNNIELRLGGNIVNTHLLFNRMGLLETVSQTTDLEPIYTGIKFYILEESGFIPELAIMGHVGIPKLSTLDNADFASDLTLAGSYSISESIGFGFNIGSHWSGNGINYQDWFYSAVIGIGHGEKLSSFWEIYSWDFELLGSKDLRVDAGITYLLRSNFQLDFSGGLGLSEYNPDYFVSCGFSWRIPR